MTIISFFPVATCSPIDSASNDLSLALQIDLPCEIAIDIDRIKMDRNGETLNEYGCNGHWSILSLGGYYGLSMDALIGHWDVE